VRAAETGVASARSIDVVTERRQSFIWSKQLHLNQACFCARSSDALAKRTPTTNDEGGGAWGTSNHTAGSGRGAGQTIIGDFSITGGLAGGTIGCNYQSGGWVLGVEGDMS
jgi:hypothetical protein